MANMEPRTPESMRSRPKLLHRQICGKLSDVLPCLLKRIDQRRQQRIDAFNRAPHPGFRLLTHVLVLSQIATPPMRADTSLRRTVTSIATPNATPGKSRPPTP